MIKSVKVCQSGFYIWGYQNQIIPVFSHRFGHDSNVLRLPLSNKGASNQTCHSFTWDSEFSMWIGTAMWKSNVAYYTASLTISNHLWDEHDKLYIIIRIYFVI